MRLDRLGVERAGGVVRILLTGAPLGRREADELVSVAGELATDREVRVVVLDSRGPDLCPGAGPDLDPASFSPDPAAALAAVRAPVVAACRGAVRSVGLELALAADLRVAGPGATFALADVQDGRLPCWGGTQRLPRAAGRPMASAMILLGEVLDAAGAHRAGLVHTIADDVGAAVEDITGTLIALAPRALELAKEAMQRGAELPMRDALVLEGDLNHLLQTTADRAEGLAAFFDRRPPSFTGR